MMRSPWPAKVSSTTNVRKPRSRSGTLNSGLVIIRASCPRTSCASGGCCTPSSDELDFCIMLSPQKPEVYCGGWGYAQNADPTNRPKVKKGGLLPVAHDRHCWSGRRDSASDARHSRA
ncbi:hypothetical protein BOSEA31B_13805 [Hyphomicrobiales bacterium]|nr:hypothetical protein BOSEA31B_13805 [Hyphomicrobiales bacterium]CAH1699575.1 hypothetical protein BOSEA1005_12628 [Hyphomicrobiales bacterium]CAI0344578.1 hypothetical protein BO1005MUT1_330245 [Hyphomicrobiales bacterium]